MEANGGEADEAPRMEAKPREADGHRVADDAPRSGRSASRLPVLTCPRHLSACNAQAERQAGGRQVGFHPMNAAGEQIPLFLA